MTETLEHGYSYESTERYLMNTNMTGFRCFSEIFALALEGLRVYSIYSHTTDINN